MNNKVHARVEQVLDIWRNEPTIAENIVGVYTIPARRAQYHELPLDLPLAIRQMLRAMGITSLYSHQLLSLEMARQGKNIVVVTGTASGKTLCYNLPILSALFNDIKARALFLFPTKALAQDQYQNLAEWMKELKGGEPLTAGVYDGDTPTNARQAVRGKARIVLSNPDMLHNGILPHHTIWAEFFKNLRFIVIDEMHTYRGVFGSHLANLIRRLKRVAAFYGCYPQFILTSATIANPQQLAERLIEEQTAIIDQDGSPSGAKHFVLYNPPVVNAELGLRASPIQEGVRLAGDLLVYNIQSIIFSRTRRSVELFLTYLRQSNPEMAERHPGLPQRIPAIRTPHDRKRPPRWPDSYRHRYQRFRIGHRHRHHVCLPVDRLSRDDCLHSPAVRSGRPHPGGFPFHAGRVGRPVGPIHHPASRLPVR